MKVSVCIPTCNGKRFVGACLESVYTQSLADLEVIAVDDASDDGTGALLQELADGRTRVLRADARLGIPANWDRAVALARGDYVCLFHQDDVMEPGNLARKAAFLDGHPAASFVHSRVALDVQDARGEGVGEWVDDTAETAVFAGRSYVHRLMVRGNLVCAPAVLMRRSALLAAGRFNPALGFAADYEMWMKLSVLGDVGFLPEPLVRYRWHAANATHAFDRGLDAEQCREARESVLSWMDARGEDGQTLERLRLTVREIHRREMEKLAAQADFARVKGDYERVLRDYTALQKDYEEVDAWGHAADAECRRVRAWASGLERDLNRLRESETSRARNETRLGAELEKARALLRTPAHRLASGLQALLRGRLPGR